MKRILFLLFASLPLMGWADTVSQQKAEQLAARFLQSAKTRGGAVSLAMVYDGMNNAQSDLSSRAAESSPYFVFNNTSGRGFVIVAGEDAAMPVLAYSTEHNFVAEGMPGNLQNWLDDVKSQIRYLREHHMKASPAVRRAWSRASSRTGELVGDVVVDLKTALWDQSAPYNEQTPMMNGKHCVTGCTNTALSIVMRYHRWPEKGKGTIPSYTIKHGDVVKLVVPERVLGQTYDWDKMPLVYALTATSEEKEQVARLMADVGTMNQTDYDINGSGASFGETLNWLPVYMDYDKSLWLGNRESYSTQEWHRVLQGELDAKRPVLYAGSNGITGGHAFVLHGYTTENYYLTNWGWGGYNNGCFLLDGMNPSENGNDASNFSLNQYGLFSVKKNEGGGYTEDLLFTDSRLQVLVSHVKTGEPFKVTGGWIQVGNNMSDSKSFTISCWLTDASGNPKEKISADKVMVRNAEGFIQEEAGIFDCKIKRGFQAGDRIRFFFKSKNTPEWKMMRSVWGNDFEVRIFDANGDTGWLTKKVAMDYNKNTGILSLTLPEGVTVELDKFFVYEPIEGHVTLENGVFSIDTHALTRTNFFRFILHEGERTKKIEVGL